MKTLYLMRHAKSAWTNNPADDGLITDHAGDHDRGLTARGGRAAKDMARYMTDNGLVPDLALCSTATRARLTLDALLERVADNDGSGQHRDLEVRYSRTLYFTDPEVILDEIRSTDDAVTRLLLVGHNPDTQSLAVHLANDVHGADVATISRKFPTGALAILTFDVDTWRDVGWGKGTLCGFIRPKAL